MRVLAVLAGVLIPALAGPAWAEDGSLWIRDVTIVSPERAGPAPTMHVVIEKGRIASVSTTAPDLPDGTRTIDATGLFLTPGLIDSHVHLQHIPGMLRHHAAAEPELARTAHRQTPRSYLYYGFTTLIDLNGEAGFIAEWNAQAVRPDAHWCGGAPLANGYPTHFIPPERRFRAMPYFLWDDRQTGRLPGGVDPADHSPSAVVRRMRADGAICVKTFFETGFGGVRDLPTPTVDMVRAVVREARALSMPVAVHANAQAAQAFVLETDADIIAHGLWHWTDKTLAKPSPDIEALLDRVAATRTGYQPTMRVIHGEVDLLTPSFLDRADLRHVVPEALIDWYASAEGQWFRDRLFKIYREPDDPAAAAASIVRRLNQSVGHLARNGARLLFGSDTPSGPLYSNPPGLNGFLELYLLHEAGMPLDRLFRAATIDNAEAFGLDDEIGTVEAGKIANLLLLKENPLESVDAYDMIEAVVLHGRMLDRADLSATRLPK